MSVKLYRGDVLTVLRRLPDCSVQCVVTSPPYWGLRDYGVAGQLGLEPTPEEYTARMVEVFREVRRVLRDDGTLWLNMGDSYAGGKTGNTNGGTSSGLKNDGRAEVSRQRTNIAFAADMEMMDFHKDLPPSLKPKDLCGIPWRLAFALQADGWYLRSDIIWHKPNPMPESVRDRPTKAHEYVFLMSKSERYFWDQEAVREELRESSPIRGQARSYHAGWSGNPNVNGETGHALPSNPSGRNVRSVWTITPKPFKGAHFATFPPALVERCIKAGTSEHGCCPQCGKAWVRVTEDGMPFTSNWGVSRSEGYSTGPMDRNGHSHRENGKQIFTTPRVSLGFRPACKCPAANPVPCVVLDPFVGSGTTAAVATSLGRDAIGIDLNPKYLTMARARIAVEQPARSVGAAT